MLVEDFSFTHTQRKWPCDAQIKYAAVKSDHPMSCCHEITHHTLSTDIYSCHRSKALVVVRNQDEDHGWIYLGCKVDCCLYKMHFVTWWKQYIMNFILTMTTENTVWSSGRCNWSVLLLNDLPTCMVHPSKTATDTRLWHYYLLSCENRGFLNPIVLWTGDWIFTQVNGISIAKTQPSARAHTCHFCSGMFNQ